MLKKFILTPIYMVMGTGLLILVVLYYTPFPYIPLNHLLNNSADFSGDISGSVGSGIRIRNLSIKGKPGGEIKAKEISFRYSGLIDYLLRGHLIVREFKWDGVSVDLSQGNFNNWSDIRRRFEDRLFLVPPLRNTSLNAIQIENLLVRDVDVRIGKKQTEDPMGLSPMMFVPALFMSSKLMGVGSQAAFPQGVPPNFSMPGAPQPTPAPQKRLSSFKMVNFEWNNIRVQTPFTEKSMTLHVLKLKNLAYENSKFDLGGFEFESDNVTVVVTKGASSGPTWETMVLDIRGAFKRGPEGNLIKDIDFNGELANKKLSMSAFENKVKIVAGQSSGSFMPAAEITVSHLNLPDYFINVAPLTNISCTQKMAFMSSGGSDSSITFDLGKSSFLGSWGGKTGFGLTGPRDVLTAQHRKIRNLSTTLYYDPAVKGSLRLKLWKSPYPVSPALLLSTVWFDKEMVRLNAKEKEELMALAPYFGLDPKEFSSVSTPRPLKKGKVRRRK